MIASRALAHGAPSPRQPRPRGLWAVLAGTFAGLGLAPPAHAYRPFDGTDADVAAAGEHQLELGPVHFYREAGASFLIAPGGVLNLGLVDRLELVADFKNFVSLAAPAPGSQRDRLRETDLLLKVLLRPGCLQNQAGPSLALEAGVLFPETGTSSGLGAQANGIASLATRHLLMHFNESIAGNRDHRLELMSSYILEVGSAQRLHPVSELFVDHVLGGSTVYSVLLGALWPYSEKLVFDLAGRAARVAGHPAWELRLGFTWTARIWGG